MKKTMLKIVAVAVVLFACAAPVGARESQEYSRLEKKADRTFIMGQYDRAMDMNRRAEDKLPEGSLQQLRLELKMARLYTLMQRYDDAIDYYAKVLGGADTLLTVEDVCLYIDNLRLVNKPQQAEVVARNYAFRSPYNRNQRYMNTLTALSNKQHYYGRGDSDYRVRLYDKSSSKPEYWIGNYGDEIFYAVSHSTLQDPLKIYYHRSQYFSSDEGSSDDDSPLKVIPRELHSGPLAFSPDNSMMVATGIDYSFNDRIFSIDRIRGLYPTQLFYSIVEEGIGRWSAFEPLFSYVPGYSYAHPSFFDEGRSIIFSSDCPGGYGGMDLYVCHWNEAERKWSEPANVGPYVNTEGDEIYPLVRGNRLYFSSNGLEGFGGYDIYHIIFSRNMSSVGSLFHYPHPINTTSNDFGAFIYDNDQGYFISDRRGAEGKDDIYTFDSSVNSLGSDLSIGVSEQFSAMKGNLNLIKGLGESGNENLGEKDLELDIPAEGELLVSIYFDFDQSDITAESAGVLDALIADRRVKLVDEVSVIGYADELGTEQYNMRLSERRAREVARYLTREDFKPALSVEGRGQLVLTSYDYSGVNPMYNLVENGSNVGFSDRIKLVRKARRVDIYVKKR